MDNELIRANLILITGVSGAGKDTLLSWLFYDIIRQTPLPESAQNAQKYYCAAVELEGLVAGLIQPEELSYTNQLNASELGEISQIKGDTNIESILQIASTESRATLVKNLRVTQLRNRASLTEYLPIEPILSLVTRPIRDDEEAGLAYDFVTEEEFQAIIDRDGFLEHATVYGYSYGTSEDAVSKANNRRKVGIKLIDAQGAKKIKERCRGTSIKPHIIQIDIDDDIMEVRLGSRSEQYARRMEEAPVERTILRRISDSCIHNQHGLYASRIAMIGELIYLNVLPGIYALPNRPN
ncbi:MAG: hypothetical protein ABIG95_04230 [Candidatus Woesearchaeota archaeon]